jgi:WD40 repeat protein
VIVCLSSRSVQQWGTFVRVNPRRRGWQEGASHPSCNNAWSAEPSTSGSFGAVSTCEPEIEVWNLDVIDALQPVLVLGGHSGDVSGVAPELQSEKRRNKQGFKEGSHRDSVLALAWNSTFRNALASGSADRTIKVHVPLVHIARVHPYNHWLVGTFFGDNTQQIAGCPSEMCSPGA